MRPQRGNAVAIAVTATELWYANLRAGRCFTRGIAAGAGGAGTLNEIQLLNPVGSGVQALVRCLFPGVNVADSPTLRRFDTALATLQGPGVNLLFGGAAAQCVVRNAAPAALDGTLLTPINIAPNTSFDISSQWIVELSPGMGLLVANGTANLALTAAFF